MLVYIFKFSYVKLIVGTLYLCQGIKIFNLNLGVSYFYDIRTHKMRIRWGMSTLGKILKLDDIICFVGNTINITSQPMHVMATAFEQQFPIGCSSQSRHEILTKQLI